MIKHSLQYKIATEPKEFAQINRLNYQTFVEEIPQHAQNATRALVDKFDVENTYIIAKRDDEVVGMIAVRSIRPFSLDHKLDNLDDFLPDDAIPCEIRLLSVKKEYRSTFVFFQLCDRLVSYCLEKNYTMALISGTVRQLKLYKRMGFQPFASLVGEDDAKFQPMFLTRESFEKTSKAFQRLMIRKTSAPSVLSYLPGPVSMEPRVEKAFHARSISHRSDNFIMKMDELRKSLCELTNSNHAQIVVGTGTLANDLVAAQLQTLTGEGLILANGEFGYRLIDHANRFGLSFTTIKKEWNEKISLEEISTLLSKKPSINWLWSVHCETSTGYLYDLKGIVTLCEKHGVKVCIDACSSVGVVPVNLQGCYLATTVSGKGLGSYPGLAIVFHSGKIKPHSRIPRYLDLGMYDVNDSIPYTHSSNLVLALRESLTTLNFQKKEHLGIKMRKFLKSIDLKVLGDEFYSPGVITIELNEQESSRNFGDRCKNKGILLSYESEYLLKKNWIQLALMGAHKEDDVIKALIILQEEIAQSFENRYV